MITHDANSSASTYGTSLTFSHTVGAGSDKILIVGVGLYSNKAVSGITYNGVSLNFLAKQSRGSPNVWTELWYLKNPDSGTHDIVITNSITRIVGGASSYFGVEQASTFGTVAKRSSWSRFPSVDVSSAIDELVVDAFACQGANTATVGAGQTQRWNRNYSTYVRGGGSSEAGAGTVTMSWTLGGNENWAIVAVAMKPAAEPEPEPETAEPERKRAKFDGVIAA